MKTDAIEELKQRLIEARAKISWDDRASLEMQLNAAEISDLLRMIQEYEESEYWQ